MRPSRPLPERGPVLGRVVHAWIVVLAVLVLGPTLAPGYVLSYDMVWVPHLSVTRPDTWGLGSGLPRAVPSDAVVAMLGVLMPQQLVQKLVLLVALIGAGAGGARLARDLGPAARFAAASILVWNPFVAERLGLGHWPLLLAYAAVPWLVVAVRERRFARGIALLAVTAVTPASGVMAIVAVLVLGRPRDGWRWFAAALAVNAPWILASLVSPAALTSDPRGIDVFASRGAGSTPAWLEVAVLGGVWNGDVRPPSRESVLATAISVTVVAIVAAGWVRLWRSHRDLRRVLVLAAVGSVVALIGAVAPSATSWLVDSVPGAGLVRDGSRWAALVAPALALGLAAAVQWLADRAAAVGWLVALLLPVAVVPDLGWGLAGRLEAVDYPQDWHEVSQALADQNGPGDVLSLPFSAFRAPEWNGYRPVLDPAGRYFDRVTVTDDTLRVGGLAIAGEDPRAARIGRALSAGDWDAIAQEGIGFVVLDTSAPGADATRAQVADLPEVASAGTMRLLAVPDPVEHESASGRVVVVVIGWLTAAIVLAGAAVATAARLRRDRART